MHQKRSLAIPKNFAIVSSSTEVKMNSVGVNAADAAYPSKMYREQLTCAKNKETGRY